MHSERRENGYPRKGCPCIHSEYVAWDILRGIMDQVTEKGCQGWVCGAMLPQRDSSPCHIIEPIFLHQTLRDLRLEKPWWDWVHSDLVDPQFQGHHLLMTNIYLSSYDWVYGSCQGTIYWKPCSALAHVSTNLVSWWEAGTMQTFLKGNSKKKEDFKDGSEPNHFLWRSKHQDVKELIPLNLSLSRPHERQFLTYHVNNVFYLAYIAISSHHLWFNVSRLTCPWRENIFHSKDNSHMPS